MCSVKPIKWLDKQHDQGDKHANRETHVIREHLKAATTANAIDTSVPFDQYLKSVTEDDVKEDQREMTGDKKEKPRLLGSVINDAIESVLSIKESESEMESDLASEGAEGGRQFGNPNVIDVRAIVSMLENMKLEVKTAVREEIRTDTGISEMQRKLHLVEFKEEAIIGTVSKMQQVMQDMQEKIEVLEVNNAKRMLILTGFETNPKKKFARQQLSAFLSEEVGVQVSLEDFYYMETPTPERLC